MIYSGVLQQSKSKAGVALIIKKPSSIIKTYALENERTVHHLHDIFNNL